MVRRSSNSRNACALCTVQPQFLWKGATAARGNCHRAPITVRRVLFSPSVSSMSPTTVLLYPLHVSLVAQQYATRTPRH